MNSAQHFFGLSLTYIQVCVLGLRLKANEWIIGKSCITTSNGWCYHDLRLVIIKMLFFFGQSEFLFIKIVFISFREKKNPRLLSMKIK